MANTNVLNYIAGLFDGEGCAGIYRPCQLHASLSMGQREGLDVIISLFSGELSIEKGKHEYNKPMFVLVYSSSKAEQFLRTILPYLCVKKSHVNLVLETWECLKFSPRWNWRNIINEYDAKRIHVPNQGGGRRGKDKKPRRKRGYFRRWLYSKQRGAGKQKEFSFNAKPEN